MVKLINQSDNKLLTFDFALRNSRANSDLKDCFHLRTDGTASSKTVLFLMTPNSLNSHHTNFPENRRPKYLCSSSRVWYMQQWVGLANYCWFES